MNEQIQKAAETIINGGIILYPTDTVWGIGCDPANEAAVKKVLDLKGANNKMGLIVLVSNERLLKKYVKEIPDVCYDLLDYANGPMTIVYPRGQYVSENVLGPEESIAVRLTDNEFCSKVMNNTKCGLVSTSANISGDKTPGTFEEVSKEIRDGVDYVVDGIASKSKGQASQIIKIGLNSEVEIIRK